MTDVLPILLALLVLAVAVRVGLRFIARSAMYGGPLLSNDHDCDEWCDVIPHIEAADDDWQPSPIDEAFLLDLTRGRDEGMPPGGGDIYAQQDS